QFVPQGQSPEDLVVTFTMPDGRPTLAIVHASNELHIAIPTSVTIGLAQITVTRTDTVKVFKNGHVENDKREIVSNAAKIDPNGTYVFVTAPEVKYSSQG